MLYFESLLNKEFNTKPSYSIKKEDNELILSISVPSLEKDDLDINVEDDILIVKSEKENDFINPFEKIYSISKIDKDKITSSLENGILKIKLPYKDKHLKKIKIT